MVYLICIIAKRGFGIMHKTLNKSLGLIYLFLEYCISNTIFKVFFYLNFNCFFYKRGKELFEEKEVWDKTNFEINKAASDIYIILMIAIDNLELRVTKIEIIN